MKRETGVQVAVAALLVTVGVALRVAFQDLPNVAPVAAIALFSGYFLRHWALAVCVPLGIMALSDRLMGGYEGLLMLAVYGMLLSPVALRPLLRGKLGQSGGWTGPAWDALRLGGCSLASSLAFFLVTNGTCWWVSGRYALTLSGLGSCYLQALPFFRYTLVGDLLFTAAIFAAYAVVRAVVSASAVARRVQPAAV